MSSWKTLISCGWLMHVTLNMLSIFISISILFPCLRNGIMRNVLFKIFWSLQYWSQVIYFEFRKEIGWGTCACLILDFLDSWIFGIGNPVIETFEMKLFDEHLNLSTVSGRVCHGRLTIPLSFAKLKQIVVSQRRNFEQWFRMSSNNKRIIEISNVTLRTDTCFWKCTVMSCKPREVPLISLVSGLIFFVW